MRKALSTLLLLLALTTLASAQTNEQYLVNNKTLNMRSGAGKEYEVIANLSINSLLDFLGKTINARSQTHVHEL